MTDDVVLEFLDTLPPDRRDMCLRVHDIIRGAAPTLDTWVWRGRMWGGTEQTILGHGRTHYVDSNGDEAHWFLIGLANQKAYVSLYVNAIRDNRYLGQVYGDRLGKVKLGSASISFRRLDDLDLAVLAEMVSEAAETDG